MLFRIARRKLTRFDSCSATPCATSWASTFGVLHLEDVQLHLLVCQLFQLAPDAVGFRPAAADHDAGPGRVDIDPDAIPRALDLDLGDAGTLHAFGHQPPDRHVLLDVIRVLLVGEPPALEVGRDTEAEPVRVDLLTHLLPRLIPAHAIAMLAHDRPRPFRAGASMLSTSTVMWEVRLRMR